MYSVLACLLLLHVVYGENDLVESRGAVYLTSIARRTIVSQITFPWMKKEKAVDQYKTIKIDVPQKPHSPLSITCQRYESITLVDVYNNEAVWIDSFILLEVQDEVCDENRIKKYFVLPDHGELNIKYLWNKEENGKRCKERVYFVKICAGSYENRIERKGVHDVDCPTEITDFLKTLPDGGKGAGVETLLPEGNHYQDVNYFYKMEEYKLNGPTESEEITTKGEKDSFQLKCRKYQRSMCERAVCAATGDGKNFDHALVSIKHEESDFVLDRLKMASCTYNNVKITRRTVEGRIEYVLGIMAYDNNHCYKVKYTISRKEFKYFDKTTVVQYKPKRTFCPVKTWSWLVRLRRWIRNIFPSLRL